VLLASGSARADDGIPAVRALYVGAEPGAEAADRAAAVLAGLEQPLRLAEPAVHLAEFLPSDGFVTLGLQRPRECAEAAWSTERWQTGLAVLRDALRSVGETGPIADQLDAAWPCLEEVVAAGELAETAFVRGLVAASEGDEEGALGAFAGVFAVDPEHAWNPDFPPTAQLLFARAGAEALAETPATLAVIGPPGAALWLDGRPLASGEPAELVPGRHLLQLRAAGTGEVRGLALEVPAGGRGTVVLPGAWSDGAAPAGGFVGAVGLVLAGLLAEEGPEPPRCLVVLGAQAAAWCREEGRAELVEQPLAPALPPELVEATTKRRLPNPAGPILFGVGLGLAGAGGIVFADNWPKLNELNDDVEAGRTPWPDEGVSCEEATGAAERNCERFAELRDRVYASYGLMGGGGAMALIAIPIGVATLGRPQQVSLSFGLRLGPGEQGGWIGLSVSPLGPPGPAPSGPGPGSTRRGTATQ